MQPMPVHAVQRRAKTGDALHVHGMCTSVESVHKRVASRVVRCPHCGEAQALLQLAGVPLQQCCAEGSSTHLSAWDEDVIGRIFIPVSRPLTHASSVQLVSYGQCHQAYAQASTRRRAVALHAGPASMHMSSNSRCQLAQ